MAGLDALISVVIPCRNDAVALAATLDHLSGLARADRAEVIVAASGDEAATTAAVSGRAQIIWPHGSTRAELLNAGAAAAHAPVLLFLHADCYLPTDAVDQIERAFQDPAVHSGAFAHRFSEADWRLAIVSLIDRIRYRVTRNYYGDQAQFVRTATFRRLGGFAPVQMMEDLDLSQRLKRCGGTALISTPVRTSGRRFLQRGPWRTLVQCGLLLTWRACGADVDRYAERWRGPAHLPPGSAFQRRWRAASAVLGWRGQ